MIERIEQITTDKLRASAGAEFPMLKKIRIGGTGSMKMIHLNGVDFINELEITSQSQYYLAFELRPSALIGRAYGGTQKTFFIKKEHIKSINFETFKLKVVTIKGIRIRHEAIVKIELKNQVVKVYAPATVYKAAKSFFRKDWLRYKAKFVLNNKEIQIDNNMLLLDIISKFVEA